MTAATSDFALDLARPLRTADGTIRCREGTLLRIYDAESDTAGLGEATPLGGWTESLSSCREALDSVREAIEDEGIPEVTGRTVPAPDEHAALAAVEEEPAARHALASALLDQEARRRRIPLYRTLGAASWVRQVPVNGTLGDGTVTHTAQAAVSAVKRGFDCLKVKVGARSVEDDVERLAAVRDVLGDTVALRADANASWTRRQADRAFEAIEAQGIDLAYVEQPLAGGDLEGLARLRRDHETPVAVDESLVDHSPREVIAEAAADVLVCKPMVLGGPDRVADAAEIADEAGLETVVTTTIDGVVARTTAVHAAASLDDPLPCGLATADRLATDLGPDPATVGSGRMSVPQDDGVGPIHQWWPAE